MPSTCTRLRLGVGLGLLLCLCLATTTAAAAGSSSSSEGSSRLHPQGWYLEHFRAWAAAHNVSLPYERDGGMGRAFRHRLAIWAENNDFIERHNNAAQALSSSYTMAHNHYSHLTFDEFKARHLGWTKPLSPRGPVAEQQRLLRGGLRVVKGVPESVDWVALGKVTPVKDQGQCGSCYSFSATGAIEGAYAIQHGELIELSMQQIVDCDDLDGGCEGGEMQQAFQWAQENGGLCLLTDYPYTSGASEQAGRVCRACSVVNGTAPQTWTQVTPGSEPALLEALAQQPVSVAVAVGREFMFYHAGVYTGGCEAELNHGVLAVGYGTDDAEEETALAYWTIKNSWGSGWGEAGYIRVARNGAVDVACGILEDASYPTLPPAATVPAPESVDAIDTAAAAAVPAAAAAVGILPPAAPAAAAVVGTEAVDAAVLPPLGGSASARDCGGGTAVFPTISIAPQDVQKDTPVSVHAEGVLNKPTLSGTYTLAVIYEGAQLYSHSGNVCGEEQVTLPLNAGTIQLHGLPCPANPGPVAYGLEVTLPSIAPSGDYDIKLTGVDQDHVPLLCIEAKLSL